MEARKAGRWSRYDLCTRRASPKMGSARNPKWQTARSAWRPAEAARTILPSPARSSADRLKRSRLQERYLARCQTFSGDPQAPDKNSPASFPELCGTRRRPEHTGAWAFWLSQKDVPCMPPKPGRLHASLAELRETGSCIPETTLCEIKMRVRPPSASVCSRKASSRHAASKARPTA